MRLINILQNFRSANGERFQNYSKYFIGSGADEMDVLFKPIKVWDENTIFKQNRPF